MSGIKSIAPDTDTGQVAVTMAFALGFGVLAVFASLWNHGTIWHGLLWAGAWSSVGWFLGFLFGIPRYLSTDTARTATAPSSDAANDELASAVANAKELREAASQAANDKTAADAASSQAAQAADQAAGDSAEATAKFAGDQQDTALRDDADAKAKTAELAKRTSDDETAAANAAGTKAQSADKAASEAEAVAEAAKSKVAKASTSAAASPGSSLTVNTNLEQISDWLTKIIVGVALVESQTLLDKMQKVATFMAKSMVKASEAALQAAQTPESAAASSVASGADTASAVAPSVPSTAVTAASSLESFSSTESFAYSVMLYFLATGLLGSYLLTRLFLQRAFEKVAHGASRA